jgi:hypothetical protein
MRPSVSFTFAIFARSLCVRPAARVRKIALKHKMAGMIDVVEVPA